MTNEFDNGDKRFSNLILSKRQQWDRFYNTKEPHTINTDQGRDSLASWAWSQCDCNGWIYECVLALLDLCQIEILLNTCLSIQVFALFKGNFIQQELFLRKEASICKYLHFELLPQLELGSHYTLWAYYCCSNPIYCYTTLWPTC